MKSACKIRNNSENVHKTRKAATEKGIPSLDSLPEKDYICSKLQL